MKRSVFLLPLLLATTGSTLLASAAGKHSFKPKAGYVPDSATAIRIAEAVWIPIYGARHIEGKKPFKAVLRDGVWTVEGSLTKGWKGGVPVAEISKDDARILRISHDK